MKLQDAKEAGITIGLLCSFMTAFLLSLKMVGAVNVPWVWLLAPIWGPLAVICLVVAWVAITTALAVMYEDPW